MSNGIAKVSIVIPVFNEEQYLQDCLSSLQHSDYPQEHIEIIVVDNGSTDNSVSIARSNVDTVLLYPDVNVGAVRNHGVANAKGEMLIFIDSDCTINKQWIQAAVDLLNSDDKLVAGGCLFLRNNPGWVERLWLLQESGEKVVQSQLMGSCTVIRKEHFLALGGFNEQVTSGEDSDLSIRAKQAGYTVQIYEELGVVHLGNPTTITDFLARQIWHSENYIHNLAGSLRDIMFWLVCAFLLGCILMFAWLLQLSVSPLLPLLLLLLPPAVLSAKRILRAGYKPLASLNALLSLSGIYLLDVCYLLGRSLGLLKGAGKSLLKFFQADKHKSA